MKRGAARLRWLWPVWALLSGPVQAGPETLPELRKGPVATVRDGDSFRMKDGDVDVRLIGLRAPEIAKGRTEFHEQPLGEEAHRALQDLLRGHAVSLRVTATAHDRNGRILAHAIRDDGLWVEQEMLRLGWARVYTFPDNRDFADELYAAEHEARLARRGLWANPAYAVRGPEPAPLLKNLNTFQIVEGRVVSAAKVRGRVYLNFGPDFLTDFTVSIDPEALGLFAKAKTDPLSLEGRTIRARGYVRSRNGPMIDVGHPEQIEIVP